MELSTWLAPLSPLEQEALVLSVRVAGVAVIATLIPAFGLALVLAHGRFPGRMLLDGLVHLPMVLPPVVTGYLLLVLFGANGPVGSWLERAFGFSFMFSWTGAALAAGVMALPLMVRALRLSLEAIDARLVHAARTLGASRLNAFCTVSLPLALPGVLAALVLGFARSLGEFGATITFVSSIEGQTRTLPLAIHAALQMPGGEAAAARLSVLAIILSLAGLVLSEAMARRARLEQRP
jgi:molybdate transport system permease protein